MVKRILRVINIILLLLLLLNTLTYAIESNNYTSPYYSDTSKLEDAQIIDYLYEEGLMDGLIQPKEGKLGIFGPYDAVTYQQFYAIMNQLFEVKLSTTIAKTLPRELALVIFRKYQRINNIQILCKLPEQDNKILTRLELAQWVYSINRAKATIGEDIAQKALQYIGSRYARGGTSPSGFDCSGFTQYIYAQFGYTISRTCNGQYKDGIYISFTELRPGDIVLFERTYRAFGCTHAGIYIGDNLFAHAANLREGVIISSLLENYYYTRFVCGRRIIP